MKCARARVCVFSGERRRGACDLFFLCVCLFSFTHIKKKRQKGLFSTNAKTIHTLAAPSNASRARARQKKIRMRFVSPQGLEPIDFTYDEQVFFEGGYRGIYPGRPGATSQEELHQFWYILCLRFLKAGLKSLFSFLC